MTPATAAGLERFAWWPDWRGECVAIVAGGPSIKGTDLGALRDRIHVIAIKVAVDLCPWAEVCYGCDAAWWIDRKGLPKYHGIKLSHGHAAKDYPGMHRVEIDMAKDSMLVNEPLKLGNGGNSGFQAINLAIQFGASDIILLGFDCHERGGNHWYGRNKWLNANNPMGTNYNRWMRGFEAIKRELPQMGVTVVNASPQTAINSFPRMPLAEVMQDWGL
jgi:hypothetical protein